MPESPPPPRSQGSRAGLFLAIVALALGAAAFTLLPKDHRPAANPAADRQPPLVAAAPAERAQDEAALVDAPPASVESDLPLIPFVDVTQALGITFVQRGGAAGEKLLPESGGSGCALFDYDNDGDWDLLFISGRAWPWDEQPPPPPPSTLALYRNDGESFADVTDEAGLTADFYGQGPAVGDVDGDGDDDLFVTAVGLNRFYRNDGGRFAEVAAEVGLSGKPDDWTTSAGFFDYDRDGDLDLFVCNYMRWSRELDEAAPMRIKGAGRSYATPSNFEGVNNSLYRNDGGRFTDVSAEAGIQVADPATGKPLAKSLAVTFVDFDGDGWLDVFVANDEVRHFLYRNRGDGTFEEIGEDRGFAFNAAGATTSGMGVDAAWTWNDERLAVAVSNFAGEMTEFYVTQEGEPAYFADEAAARGVGKPSYKSLTFGLLFDDLDLDGRVELVHANGHLEETVNEVTPDEHYAQPTQVFWNSGQDNPELFVELPRANLGDLAKPIVGRGLASGDLDGDGDLDLVLTQVGGPPLVARNDQSTRRHWLRVRLQGPVGNPHAIGAVVELHAGGVTQRRTLMPSRSYLSYCEPVVTFGLGDAATVERLVVTWPDGVVQEVAAPAVDQVVTIQPPVTSFSALANRGKAMLENGEFEPAVQVLQEALAVRPASRAVRRNLVRAYLMSNRPAEAIAALNQLGDESPTPDAGSAYLRGLAELRQTDFSSAAESFSQAVKRDPNDATLRFQWALALLGLNRADEARAQFEKTVELDPLHGAAQYQLAALARKSGDQDAYGRYMRDYLRIRDLRGAVNAAALEACRYTVAEAPELSAVQPAVLASPVAFTTSDLPIDGADGLAVSALGVTGVEDSGRYRIAAVAENGELLSAEFDAEGRLRQTARRSTPIGAVGPEAVLRVANALVDPQDAGNPQGDQPEIAIVTPSRSWLVRKRGPDVFEDLTATAKLEGAAGVAAQWVDVEHDGDVDLCVAGPAGLQLWRNNGDGTFANMTADYGLESAPPSAAIAAADFDGMNLGVDLVLAGSEGATLMRNQLAGKFARDAETAAAWPAATRLLVDDFNNDGRPDVVFLRAGAATLLITGGDQRQEIPLAIADLDAATTIDVDNDGWLDVIVAGDGKTWLLRNLNGLFGESPPPLAFPAAGRVRQLLDLDADGDGDTDLVIVGGDGRLRVLRNDSPSASRQLKLAINSYVGHPSSIGVRVQVRAKDLLVSRWTQRELPIEIGMGAHDIADSVQTLWPNGIAKNEIGVRVGRAPLRISIIEFIRTDSCPFLYAFQDGRWAFLNDLLGAAPLNVVVARGVLMSGDPDEAVILGPAERFRDGAAAARLRVTSELREVIYIDQLRLLAVDHPAGTMLFSRDRVAPIGIDGPQFLLGHDSIGLQSALGSDGVDRTAALAAEDGRFAPPGRVLPPPVVGFTEPLALELDFGPLRSTDELLLALTGWFRFGSSSANIASSQRSDLQVIWPRLEALGADGQWRLVEEVVGLPAGNTKTIVCDLRGKLPDDVKKLRLTTSFEVRWDRIDLVRAADEAQLRVAAAEPTTAELAWHGFCELRPKNDDEPQSPNLDRMADRPLWLNTVAGWCTRYGEIAPLVTEADGELAILNSGDGVTLIFPSADLPPEDQGRTRTLVLATHGWIKAADPNSEPDLQVWPFPGSGAPFAEEQPMNDWQLQYNTRWVPGDRFLGR